MNIQKIKTIPLLEIMDKLGVKYYKKTWDEYWIEDEWWKTSWRSFNVWKNIVSDFSKDRPSWDQFWFVKSWNSMNDIQTFKWFEENFTYLQSNTMTDNKKPIRIVWDKLWELQDNQKEYLKWRWIEYEKVKDIVKDYNWWIWCLIYETNTPKWLMARTLKEDHKYRFAALTGYPTKWIYQHNIDTNKDYLIIVEWLIDFLTLRQFDSNVIWLKSAESWIDEVIKYANNYRLIFIPDNDEAWQKTIEKFSWVRYALFDLSKFWDYKDINDMFKDIGNDEIITAIREEAKDILPISSTFEQLYTMQDIMKERGKLWFDWPFPKIYDNTSWVIPWKVYTIGAYSNVGKSKFAYHHVQYFLKENKSVLFLNLEVDEPTCLMNIIQSYEGKRTQDMIEWYKPAQNKYSKLIIRSDLYMLDQIIEEIEKVSPDIVFIDFVQNIQWKGWWDYEQNASIAKTIQRTAIKTWSTIFCLSQLSNSVWRDVAAGRTEFVSLKWSGEYFASSDVILILSKWDYSNEIYVKIQKNKFWYNWLEFVLDVDYDKNNFKFNRKLDIF